MSKALRIWKLPEKSSQETIAALYRAIMDIKMSEEEVGDIIWPGELEVVCVSAEDVTDDYVAVEFTEKDGEKVFRLKKL